MPVFDPALVSDLAFFAATVRTSEDGVSTVPIDTLAAGEMKWWREVNVAVCLKSCTVSPTMYLYGLPTKLSLAAPKCAVCGSSLAGRPMRYAVVPRKSPDGAFYGGRWRDGVERLPWRGPLPWERGWEAADKATAPDALDPFPF